MPRNPNKSDWSGGLPACITSFSVIEDPRTEAAPENQASG